MLKVYKRTFNDIKKKMERYIEMGFSDLDAEAAIERYGDNLHGGCHWLMTRDSMGRVPKRLRTSDQDKKRTYLGSIIRFEGIKCVVDEFDEKHALIRIREDISNKVQWEHIGDGRIEWLQTHHNSGLSKTPQYAWKRQVGNVYLKLDYIPEVHRASVSVQNALAFFAKYGFTLSSDQQVLRAMTSFSREHLLEPSGYKPRQTFHPDDIHRFKVELMTYFHAIFDIYNCSHEECESLMYRRDFDGLLSKFPANIREKMASLMQRWKLPLPYMKKKAKEWRGKCLPLVLFECERIESNIAHFTVNFHSMTFLRSTPYEPGVHEQYQRLFAYLWPTNLLKKNPVGMSSIYLKSVLQDSRKKHLTARAPGESFVSELLPYQKQCLNWLVYRETQQSTSAWGWTKHQLTDGFVFYTSIFGHLSLDAPNEQIHGGLLAQDVGMGKTVEMLALIATNKAQGPTLVVVPTTMLGQWQEEASKHTPSLTVLKFHGARRPKDMDVLRNSDIVLTTYRVVVNETSQHIPTIGAVKWGRIILDESHEIKTMKHATTKAVLKLFAPLKWCVSATPWTRGLQSVVSMLSFLGVSPFALVSRFGETSAVQHLIRYGFCTQSHIFHNIITEATLWQNKRHVRLRIPPVTETSIVVQNNYSNIYAYLLEVIRAKIAEDSADSTINSRTRLLHYSRWLRLAATHPFLNRISDYGVRALKQHINAESIEIESFLETLGNAKYDQSLRDIIESWRNGQEKCSICMDAMDRPTLTPCHHLFCFECIQSAYQHDTLHRCPLCREEGGIQPLEELKLQDDIQVAVEETDCYMLDLQGNTVQMPKEIHIGIQSTENEPGNKLQTVVNMVQQSTEKFIVFTQFHSVMKMLCKTLKNTKIPFASIEGRMSPKQRSTAISLFQTDVETRVFVMTTKTASVGITLTAGSQIIFLEPSVSESVKKQAIGRAWRIGQEKPVVVTTLQTEDTIDCIDSNNIHSYIRGIIQTTI